MRKLTMLLVLTGLIAFSSTAYATGLPSNFDPNPGTLVDISTDVEFKWNGPGESQYPFVQSMICFEDPNSNAYSCLDAGVHNYKTMTMSDWNLVDGAMSAISGNTVELNWYIQARFSDDTSVDNQEFLESDPWLVSYDREQLEEVDEEEDPAVTPVTSSKLEVLDFNEGSNSIALDVGNLNLDVGDFYFAECVNQEQPEDSFDDLRFISREQPPNYENELSVQLMVGPLDPGTEYGCYAALKSPASLPGQFSITNHSDWIYTSTLENAATKVDFDLPPAGYEDEIITRIDQFVNPFPDTDLSVLNGQAAGELYRRAIIGGYPDGEFKGTRAVNRAEAAKFLLLGRYATVDDVTGDGGLSDVLPGEWYVKFVVTASNLGIINGYPDGTFKPGNTVKISEFLKMISLTFGLEEDLSYDYLDVSATDWFAKYAGVAKKYNLFPGNDTYLKPGTELTRNEVAVAIYQYLLNR